MKHNLKRLAVMMAVAVAVAGFAPLGAAGAYAAEDSAGNMKMNVMSVKIGDMEHKIPEADQKSDAATYGAILKDAVATDASVKVVFGSKYVNKTKNDKDNAAAFMLEEMNASGAAVTKAAVKVGADKTDEKTAAVMAENALKEDTAYRFTIKKGILNSEGETSSASIKEYTFEFRTKAAAMKPADPTTPPAVTPSAVMFKDMENHWAKKDVEEMAARKLVNGVDAENFAPQNPVTRAQFAALLSRALKLTDSAVAASFTDVKEGAWYEKEVNAAAKAGIVMGADQMFRPEDKITRQEMALMIMRAYTFAGGKAVEKKEMTFTDKEMISSWAVEGVQNAYSLGILKGNPAGAFEPMKNATRAESVVVLKGLLDKLA